MAQPVKKFTILKEIRDRLFSITKSNGYHFDIQKVDVARQEQFQNTDIPAINVSWRGDDAGTQNHGSSERIMTILIGAFSTEYEKDLTAAEISFELEEDIIHALNRSPLAPTVSDEPNRDLGGIVKEITSHTAAQINKGRISDYVGVLIEFDVRYVLDSETLN